MELRHLVKRTAVVGATSIIAGGVLLYGAVLYQDWSKAKDRRNFKSPPPPPPLTVENPPSPESFSPIRVVPSMPAITDIKTVAADEIRDEIADDDLVLGVVIEGEARAYSINMMTGPDREIFNDELAGRSIAATW